MNKQPQLPFPATAKPAPQSIPGQQSWIIRDDEGRVIGSSPHAPGTADYEADAHTVRGFDAAVLAIVAAGRKL